MSDQVIPKEYEWIKPGVVVAHPRHRNVTYKFATEPFISESFWDRDVWVAENEQGTEMVLSSGWVRIETAEQTLAKARAVLAEHSEAVDIAKERMKTTPKHGIFFQLTKETKALIALADAIGGGE